MLVGKERRGEVTELDEESVLQDFVCEVCQHLSEKLVLREGIVEVLAIAVHLAPTNEGRRKEADTAAHYAQQLGYGIAVHRCHNEHGGVARRLLINSEQGGRMLKLLSRQRGQGVSRAICHQSDGFHTCKISDFCGRIHI